MRVRVTYSHCSIYVVGAEMQCPLCQTTVFSGECHQCSKPKNDQPAKVITIPRDMNVQGIAQTRRQKN